MNTTQTLNLRAINAKQMVNTARERLANETATKTVSALVQQLDELVYRDMEYLILNEAYQMSACGADLREWAISKLSCGADDGWSGRGNDRARLRFDAVREAVKDVLFIVSLK